MLPLKNPYSPFLQKNITAAGSLINEPEKRKRSAGPALNRFVSSGRDNRPETPREKQLIGAQPPFLKYQSILFPETVESLRGRRKALRYGVF